MDITITANNSMIQYCCLWFYNFNSMLNTWTKNDQVWNIQSLTNAKEHFHVRG